MMKAGGFIGEHACALMGASQTADALGQARGGGSTVGQGEVAKGYNRHDGWLILASAHLLCKCNKTCLVNDSFDRFDWFAVGYLRQARDSQARFGVCFE